MTSYNTSMTSLKPYVTTHKILQPCMQETNMKGPSSCILSIKMYHNCVWRNSGQAICQKN